MDDLTQVQKDALDFIAVCVKHQVYFDQDSEDDNRPSCLFLSSWKNKVYYLHKGTVKALIRRGWLVKVDNNLYQLKEK